MKSLKIVIWLAALRVATGSEETTTSGISGLNITAGQNICNRTERYSVTELETYSYTTTEKEQYKCGIFFTCTRDKPKNITDIRSKIVFKTKIVEECCPGFENTKHRNKVGILCTPVCPGGCGHGICVEPSVCLYDEEWKDANCTRGTIPQDKGRTDPMEPCPSGFFGLRCENQCDCAGNSSCHPIYGTCDYELGRSNETLEEIGEPETYEESLEIACNCLNASTESCNETNGACNCLPGFTGLTEWDAKLIGVAISGIVAVILIVVGSICRYRIMQKKMAELDDYPVVWRAGNSGTTNDSTTMDAKKTASAAAYINPTYEEELYGDVENPQGDPPPYTGIDSFVDVDGFFMNLQPISLDFDDSKGSRDSFFFRNNVYSSIRDSRKSKAEPSEEYETENSSSFISEVKPQEEKTSESVQLVVETTTVEPVREEIRGEETEDIPKTELESVQKEEENQKKE